MTEMKCPICQQELRKIHPTYVICDNCRITGDNELWQELIRTKKALDTALYTMSYIQRTNPISFHFEAIAKAFAEIKETLEQKEECNPSYPIKSEN